MEVRHENCPQSAGISAAGDKKYTVLNNGFPAVPEPSVSLVKLPEPCIDAIIEPSSPDPETGTGTGFWSCNMYPEERQSGKLAVDSPIPFSITLGV